MTRWLALAAVVAVLDQLVKYAVTHAMDYGTSLSVTPFFNLVLVHNPGAAFSLLADAPGWQRGLFIAIAVIAAAWVVLLLRRHSREFWFSLALALILGGAIGNVADRIVIGSVVDFLDFHAGIYHWPAFNVADSAITCGALLLVWESFRREGKKIG
jgi:signal peptidase II